LTPWYRFCRAAAFGAARVLWGLRVEGRENLPTDGPVLVACNHVSVLDPPVVGSVIPREAGFVAKQELFAVPGLGRLIRSLNAIPIDRSRLSRETLEILAGFLDGGRALVLFPEGTRSRDGRLGRARPGVGVLLLRRPVPWVCAFVEGTDAPWRNLFRRGRMRVVFGPPHTLPQELASPSPGRADARRIAESIVEEIRRLGARARPQGDGSPGAPGGGVRPAPAPRSSEFERKGWTPHS
jgi:1-acyl-sn-glycerol-3-phosphate acyltransferase